MPLRTNIVKILSKYMIPAIRREMSKYASPYVNLMMCFFSMIKSTYVYTRMENPKLAILLISKYC